MTPTSFGQTRPLDSDDQLSVLMAASSRGDQVAFAALYDALVPVVFAVLRRMLHDASLAEDVTQETFVEMWTGAPRFDPARGSVRAWAVTIARRRAIDRIRNQESQRRRTALLAQRRPDEVWPIADAVVENERATRVRRAVELLPTDQRAVLQLAFIDGRSHGAVAEHLGIPLGTVKSRVRAGLQRLAAILKEES